MSCITWFESLSKILSFILLNFFFTPSLFSLAISFASIVILLSLGQVSHFISFAILYALSQESKFISNSSNFSISCSIVLENLSSSVYLSRLLFVPFSSKMQEHSSPFSSSIKIFPHLVFAKSFSIFFMLNSSTFSFNQSSGNGLAPNVSINL